MASSPEKTSGPAGSTSGPYASNPYGPSNPKHRAFEDEKRRAARGALEGRFGTKLTKLRVADYHREADRAPFGDGSCGTAAATAAGVIAKERMPSPERNEAAAAAPGVTTPPDPTVLFTSKEPSATGATAFAFLHGGCTAWLGHKDGTIEVRTGTHLEIQGQTRFTVSPDGKAVSALTTVARADAVCVGLVDGTVACYDTCTASETWRFQPQTKEDDTKKTAGSPVSFLVPHPNKPRIFSIAECGLVCSWDLPVLTDPSPATAGSGLPSQLKAQFHLNAKVTCATVSDNALFVGTAKGSVVKLDLDDVGVVRQKQVSGGGAVVAALAAFGSHVLVAKSGSSELIALDSTTILPPATNIPPIVLHQAPILRLAYDNRSKRLWSLDEKGHLLQWDGSFETSTPTVRVRMQLPEAHRNPQLISICLADAVRLWSLSSGGENFAWWTESNPAKIEEDASLERMRRIVESEEEEIALWDKRITRAETVLSARRLACVSNLERLISLEAMRRCYWNWHAFCLKRLFIKRRLGMAFAISPGGQLELKASYWTKWTQYAADKKVENQKRTVACYLMCCTEKSMLRLYYGRLMAFFKRQRRERAKHNCGELILQTTRLGSIRVAFRKWQKSTDKGRYRHKRQCLSAVMLRNISNGLLTAYFFKFLSFTEQRKKKKRRNEVVSSLQRTTNNGMKTLYLRKWQDHLRLLHRLRLREKLCNALRQTSEFVLRGVYYRLFLAFGQQQHEMALRTQLAEEQARKVKVQDDHEKVSARIEKNKKMEELRQKIDEKKKELEAKKSENEHLVISIDDLQQQVKIRDERKAKDLSMREEFLNVMSTLKAKVINWNTDLATVHKIVEKAKTTGPGKMFLQGHIDVKRVTVEFTGEPAKPPQWNLTKENMDQELAKFPSHTHAMILGAIRTMVVALDLMTQEELDKLDTDEEIVANAVALNSMEVVRQRAVVPELLQILTNRISDSVRRDGFIPAVSAARQLSWYGVPKHLLCEKVVEAHSIVLSRKQTAGGYLSSYKKGLRALLDFVGEKDKALRRQVATQLIEQLPSDVLLHLDPGCLTLFANTLLLGDDGQWKRDEVKPLLQKIEESLLLSASWNAEKGVHRYGEEREAEDDEKVLMWYLAVDWQQQIQAEVGALRSGLAYALTKELKPHFSCKRARWVLLIQRFCVHPLLSPQVGSQFVQTVAERIADCFVFSLGSAVDDVRPFRDEDDEKVFFHRLQLPGEEHPSLT